MARCFTSTGVVVLQRLGHAGKLAGLSADTQLADGKGNHTSGPCQRQRVSEVSRMVPTYGDSMCVALLTRVGKLYSDWEAPHGLGAVRRGGQGGSALDAEARFSKWTLAQVLCVVP